MLNILHSKDTNVTQELKDVSKLILSSRRLGINEEILRVLCDKKYAEEQNTSLCKLYNEETKEELKDLLKEVELSQLNLLVPMIKMKINFL